MTITAPRPLLILDYHIYFGIKPPQNRISIIKHISKEHILYELAALNHRLKPKNKIHIDNSLETQVRELRYFTQTQELFTKYSEIASSFTKSKDEYPIIFNRQACLFAIEEIINSGEMVTIPNFSMANAEIWEALINYLLATNYAITELKEIEDNRDTDFESLNPQLLPLNELAVDTDQLFTPFRGYWLITHLLHHPEFAEETKSYFQSKYGIEAQEFVFHVLNIYLIKHERAEFNFFYFIKEGHQKLFDKLSIRTLIRETYKLIDIRKSPFINVGNLKYLIADNAFLIEKTYSQFLNDFWFDWLRDIRDENGNAKFNISRYRAEFGYFFESYLRQVIYACFENYKYSTLLMFDQLKVNTTKGKIEISDIYLRSGNKILLAQVKSGSIYDSEKYGGTADLLYKNNRDQFFDNFGVNQLVQSIINTDSYMQAIDSKFPKGHTYEIYPCIIVNDKSFQTPLMADTFNVRFQELIRTNKIKKVRINALTLIHISDLERLEDSLNKNPKEIWKLLKYNQRDKRFSPPFGDTVNRKWGNRKYSDRVIKLFRSLAKQFSTSESSQDIYREQNAKIEANENLKSLLY